MHPFTTIVGADTTKMEKRVCSSVAALSGDRCMEMFYYSYISKYTVTTCKYVYTCIRVCIYIYIYTCTYVQIYYHNVQRYLYFTDTICIY